MYWAIPEKKQTGGLRTYFYKKPPGTFHFFTLLLEIPDKKAPPMVLDPLEIPRPKTKTPGNSMLFFFWSPLEIPLHFQLTSGNSTSEHPPPLFGFFWDCLLQLFIFMWLFKGYLHYKTITSQYVPSKAQIKNFFIT